MDILSNLFRHYAGQEPEKMELLPASGSARKYYRISGNGKTCIGAYHLDREENRLFIEFSRHFREKGLHVPEIYAVSGEGLSYLQEDLGDDMLLNVVERERREPHLNGKLMKLYRQSLSELVRFQLIGGEGLDYSHCRPRPVFDSKCISWDLNYFKYCFLKLAAAEFSEQALEDDFEKLTVRLCQEDAHAFMFRDFQSRNIMVKDGEVWFIDYQGGRRGALQYDVASLLYDAIVGIATEQQEELLEYYVSELQKYRKIEPENFREGFYRFVLVRLLQALGAFGLRGLYERKQHFIDSIQPGLEAVCSLFATGNLGDDYPEIRQVAGQLYQRGHF